MTAARDFSRTVEPTGTSRELDQLDASFNELMGGSDGGRSRNPVGLLGTIRALAAALDARDPYTGRSFGARQPDVGADAPQMHVPARPRSTIIRLGALLHDIGKIGVWPTTSCRSRRSRRRVRADKRHPGPRRPHPAAGLVPRAAPGRSSNCITSGPTARATFGLRGDTDSRLAARIVHVADAFDAMTSARAYRPPRPPAAAMAELHRYAGTQFDPATVDALRTALAASPSAPERQLQALLGREASGVM